MKKHTIKNFLEFERYYKRLTKKDLVILDIDGVLFDGIFDFRTYTSSIKKEYIDFLKKIKETSNIIVLSDRKFDFGVWGEYKKQLNKLGLKFYSFEDAIKKNLNKDIAILNAKKTSMNTKIFVELVIMNYKNVYYISSQDFPWCYPDETLVNNLDKESKTNLYFFNVKR